MPEPGIQPTAPAASAAGPLRRLGSAVSLYGAALLAPRVVRLVTVPIVTHALTTTVYGSFATLWVLMPFVHILCEFGTGTAALRLAPECETPEQRRRLFATLVYARLAAVAVLSLGLAAAAPRVSEWLTGTAEHADAVRLLALTQPLGTVFDAFADELRSRERHRTLAALILTRTLSVNAFTVLLAVTLGWGLHGLVLARTFTELGLFCVGLWLCRSVLTARPSFVLLRKLLAFGAPFGVLYLLGSLRDLDRVMIRVLGSVDLVATYDLATRVVAPIALGNLALSLVLEPYLYRHASSPKAASWLDLFARVYVAGFFALALFVSACLPELFAVLAPESWRGALGATPPLLFAFVVDGVLRMSGLGADVAKRTRVWVLTSAVSVGVSLPMTLVLVPKLGALGASLGLLTGAVTATIVTYLVARRLSTLRVPAIRSVSLLLIGAAVGHLMIEGSNGGPFALPSRLLLAAAFAALGVLAMGVRPHHVRLLRDAAG